MKKFKHFILESKVSEAENYLLNLGFKKINGRWNSPKDTQLIIDYNNANKLISNGNFLVKFGNIDGNFFVSNLKLNNDSLENMPTYIKGFLNISSNLISSLKKFNTKVDIGINFSHNHLHKLENIQEFENKNDTFDVSFNMLTTLEGCPKEVGFFNCEGNWLNSAYGAPNKVNNNLKLDKKIPEIERDFYIIKSKNPGIVNYHTELLQFIYEKFKDYKNKDEKINDAIIKIKWPKGTNFDHLKKSVSSISKFNI